MTAAAIKRAQLLDIRRQVNWLRGVLSWRGLSLEGLSIVDAWRSAIAGLLQGDCVSLQDYYRPLLEAHGCYREPKGPSEADPEGLDEQMIRRGLMRDERGR